MGERASEREVRVILVLVMCICIESTLLNGLDKLHVDHAEDKRENKPIDGVATVVVATGCRLAVVARRRATCSTACAVEPVVLIVHLSNPDQNIHT